MYILVYIAPCTIHVRIHIDMQYSFDYVHTLTTLNLESAERASSEREESLVGSGCLEAGAALEALRDSAPPAA